MKIIACIAIFCIFLALTGLSGCAPRSAQIKLSDHRVINVPELRERAQLTFAPDVPPPLKRKTPALVEIHLEAVIKRTEIKPGVMYDYWTFNGEVPGPFIRARVGDTIEVHLTSSDKSGMVHVVDFQSVNGPEGGALVTAVVMGEEKVAWFKLLHPGLFLYYCTAPPPWDHMAQGMFGLMLVEPEKPLPVVDREYYVMQHEIYGRFAHDPGAADVMGADKLWDWTMIPKENKPTQGHPESHSTDHADHSQGNEGVLKYSHNDGLMENPSYVLINGRYYGHLGWEDSLMAKAGERVRIYFGNAGPNLISSFHVIGETFDRLYRDADLLSPPALSIQTALVPPGGAVVADFKFDVPGEYMVVDHAIFRTRKGAYARFIVEGEHNYDIYGAEEIPEICPEC